MSQWAAGISIGTPWGGSLSFSIRDNFENQNWVTELLEKVEADRTCHSWYQALAAAGCGIGIQP